MPNTFTLRPDGRIHLAPAGDYAHGDFTQRLTPEALARVVSAWRAAGAKELLLDYDHASRRDPAERDSQAAGWVGDLHTDADGLWGRVRWSDTGRAAVSEGRFRYCSPVFRFPDDGASAAAPFAITEVALTNKPNLPVREIANAAPSPKPPETMDITAILTALGLASDASPEQAVEAINRLKADRDALSAECENARCKEAKTVANSLGLAGDAAAKFEKLFLKSPAEAREFANAAPKPAARSLTETRPGKTPDGRDLPNGAPSAAAKDRDTYIETVRRRESCDFRRAWDIAAAEKPELFR